MNKLRKQYTTKKQIRRRRFMIYLMTSLILCFVWLCIVFAIARNAGFYFGSPETARQDHVITTEDEEMIIREEEEDVFYGTDRISFVRGDGEIEWNLILMNRTHFIDEDYVARIILTQLSNGQSVDSRCYPDLQKMMDDCRAEGYSPVICSSFRTYQKQTQLFEQQVDTYINQGMDRKAAEAKAEQSVAIPGTSEHELGLAVDITDMNNQKIVSGMESQPVQRWLMENSWKYGFILRYPADKSDITGIVYEPWHYRYVGYDAAKYIYENQITLEEYLEKYYS